MNPKQILFVCTGNSCRSVMAQGLLKQKLDRFGMEGLSVISAGVFAIEGMSPTRETQKVLQDIGVDCSAYRARSLTHQMVEEADLILAMEQFHVEEIVQRIPSAKEKVHLLKSYGLAQGAAEANSNIPDPIGKPLEVYEACFAEIQEAVGRVAKTIGVKPS